MECLVDESYKCKSNNISSTLDCKDSECCHFLKISEYEKSKPRIKTIIHEEDEPLKPKS